MRLALDGGGRCGGRGEVPVGCVVVGGDGPSSAAVATAREALADPTAHAEMVAIRAAARARRRLETRRRDGVRDAGAVRDVRGRARARAGRTRRLRLRRSEGRSA